MELHTTHTDYILVSAGLSAKMLEHSLPKRQWN